MNVSQTLSLEQKLTITLDMQLSLELLQVPINELQQVIENALQENPLLELSEEKVETEDLTDVSDETFIEENNEKFDYKELVKNFESEDYSNNIEYEYNTGKESVSPFDFISEHPTLKRYLLKQVIGLKESQLVLSVCEYIIESINDRGYLDENVTNIARQLNIKEELVEYSLHLVQGLDPCGIAARDLKECLKIQLTRKSYEDIHLYKMVDECLELLADNKFKEIAKILGIRVEKVQKYVEIIRSLEPKPSRGFNTGNDINYSIPEAYVRKIGMKYYIIMNDNILPKLNVNHLYKNIIKSDKDGKTVEYIKRKLNDAIFLIKSIERRNDTIYKVLEKIVEIQTEYLELGDAYLKPMTMNDIADSLNFNQSTISRAIKDKYISIPSKTIKIKDLFTKRIAGNTITDNDLSSIIIKQKIKALIENEDKLKPFSDQGLCNELNKCSIGISRRTVAKYREELGIKPSRMRKAFV